MSPVQVHPIHPVLVAIQTAIGAVTFLVTRHPQQQIEHLGMNLEIARRLVFTTPHAERLHRELCAEFAGMRLTTGGEQPYFMLDWETVTATLGDYDTASGQRQRLGDISLGDTVFVSSVQTVDGQLLRGEVAAIAGGQFLVKLTKPVGDMVALWASRSRIKPLVRPGVVEAA